MYNLCSLVTVWFHFKWLWSTTNVRFKKIVFLFLFPCISVLFFGCRFDWLCMIFVGGFCAKILAAFGPDPQSMFHWLWSNYACCACKCVVNFFCIDFIFYVSFYVPVLFCQVLNNSVKTSISNVEVNRMQQMSGKFSTKSSNRKFQSFTRMRARAHTHTHYYVEFAQWFIQIRWNERTNEVIIDLGWNAGFKWNQSKPKRNQKKRKFRCCECCYCLSPIKSICFCQQQSGAFGPTWGYIIQSSLVNVAVMLPNVQIAGYSNHHIVVALVMVMVNHLEHLDCRSNSNPMLNHQNLMDLCHHCC